MLRKGVPPGVASQRRLLVRPNQSQAAHMRLCFRTKGGDMTNVHNTYAGCHALAVESIYEGQGMNSAPSNPTKVVETLRSLTKWNRNALLHKQTRLMCFECRTVQSVTDAFPNGNCRLSCGHTRKTHTMSDSDYVALVNRAAKIKIVRKGVSGGVAITEGAA